MIIDLDELRNTVSSEIKYERDNSNNDNCHYNLKNLTASQERTYFLSQCVNPNVVICRNGTPQILSTAELESLNEIGSR